MPILPYNADYDANSQLKRQVSKKGTWKTEQRQKQRLQTAAYFKSQRDEN
jgi:hypothetical protein